MGLDVYLKYSKDFEAARRDEQEYEEKSDAVWKSICGDTKYEDLTDEQKKEALKQTDQVKADLGMGEFGESPNIKDVTPPQDFKGYVQPTDHIFEIGYFRSSYNSAGINQQAKVFGLMSLYDIFPEATEDDYDYHLKVDWNAALDRANAALETLKKVGLKRPGNIFVVKVSPNVFAPDMSEIKSEADAVAAYTEHYKRWGSDKSSLTGASYGSREGEFFPKGVTVKALINGEREFFGNTYPAVYAICERDDEDGSGFDYFAWAYDAYEMVKLTIEWVLEQEDPENYRLAWSA